MAAYGYAKELSSKIHRQGIGKWPVRRCYLTGVISLPKKNSFPQELLDALVAQADLPGYLGNCHASGTEILDRLGEEHMQSGKPIFYTSADSVFQIACHEETFGLERLYALCKLARASCLNRITLVVSLRVRLLAINRVNLRAPAIVMIMRWNRRCRLYSIV